MPNNLKHIIKIKVNSLINEDNTKQIRKSKSVTGDESSSRLAKASTAIEKIKDNLRSMGVSSSDVDDVYTIDQLSAMAFDIDFSLLATKFSDWDENQVVANYSGRGRVNLLSSKNNKTLVLDLENGWSIMFNPKEIETNIPGTSETILALKNDQKYTVKLGGDFDKEQLKPKPSEDETSGLEAGEDATVYEKYIKILELMGIDFYKHLKTTENVYIPQNLIEKAIRNRDEKLLSKYYKKYGKDVEGEKLIPVSEKEFIDNAINNKNLQLLSRWLSSNKKNPDGNFLGRLRKQFPNFEIGGRGSLPENDKTKLWSEVVGLPLENRHVKTLVKNLNKIMLILSRHHKTTYNKRNVKDYQRDVFSESRLVETSKIKKVDTYFVLDLKNIKTGESYDQENSKQIGGKDDDKVTFSKGGYIEMSPGKNSPWVTSNLVSNLNKVLKTGVSVRKSERHSDTIVVEWSKPFKDGTAAILLSAPDIWNMFRGNKLRGVNVRVGRKVAGEERMRDNTTGKINLPKS